MPVITFDGGKLTSHQKACLIREFTNSAAQITGIGSEAFVVLIRENSPESIGVGGEVLADRLAKQSAQVKK